jgi:hypothetical protein
VVLFFGSRVFSLLFHALFFSSSHIGAVFFVLCYYCIFIFVFICLAHSGGGELLWWSQWVALWWMLVVVVVM